MNVMKMKLLCCMYDLDSGEFKSIREQLAYIVLRGDKNEIFFSYQYNENKSQILYSYSKQQISDAFFQLPSKIIIMKL